MKSATHPCLSPRQSPSNSPNRSNLSYFSGLNSYVSNKLQCFPTVRETFKYTGAVLFGLTYFSVALAGENALENLFSWRSVVSSVVFKGLGVISAISHGASFIELCNQMAASPDSLRPLGVVLAGLGVFSALPFFTASMDGCEGLGGLSWAIAGTLYGLRLVFFVHSAKVITNLKKKNSHSELLPAPSVAVEQVEQLPAPSVAVEQVEHVENTCGQYFKNIFVYAAAGSLAACDLDSINNGIKTVADLFTISPSDILNIFANIGAVLGSGASLAVFVCWGRISVEAFTNFKTGELKNHESRVFYTCLALSLLWSALVMIGPIGIVASPSTLEKGPIIAKYIFGTETSSQCMNDEIFRIAALFVAFFPLSTYVHYKTLYRNFKHFFQKNALREELLPA